MRNLRLDPSKLSPKKGGYTIAELAVCFHSTPNAVKAWLWKLRNGYVPNEKSEGYTVETIKTPTRFVIVRNPRGSGLSPKFRERIKTPTRYKIKKEKKK